MRNPPPNINFLMPWAGEGPCLASDFTRNRQPTDTTTDLIPMTGSAPLPKTPGSPNTTPPRFHDRSGFTLVELLVVIGIILILAALAGASFQSVQKRTARVQDTSNLRQIGLAIQQYVGENDNRLPGPAWVSITLDVRVYGSMQGYNPMGVFLAPYLLGKSIEPGDAPVRFKVFESPMYRGKTFTPPLTSHYMRTTDDKKPFGNRVGLEGPIEGPKKMVSLPELYNKNLSQIWAVRLSNDTLQNGRNYLFFDGHVEWFNTGNEPSNSRP